MRKKLLLFAASLLILSGVRSQQWESGIFLGASNYMGDLAPNGVVMSETHGAVGWLVRHNLNDLITLRLGVTYGKISGSDANSSDQNTRIRNLSFRSDIYEGSLLAEINLTGYNSFGRSFSP